MAMVIETHVCKVVVIKDVIRKRCKHLPTIQVVVYRKKSKKEKETEKGIIIR